MTENDRLQLSNGDIVQHVSTGNAYIVVGRTDDVIIAVRQITITNASEWRLMARAVRLPDPEA